jgi:endogenous inhibitor of DNA gyrase (YacG/DUF329 family)
MGADTRNYAGAVWKDGERLGYRVDADCPQCGEPLPIQGHQGGARIHCSERCRLKSYRQRKAAERSAARAAQSGDAA